ncbi:PPE family protein [Mycobacterium gordonae]|uniref:PPE family protein n=1 Tax=Mycobacterium gordonae TaxID=1778 RepID=UPI001DDC4EA8|nr:PPE family protein [Mycobacterium gordonae]MBI2701429.1 PPE family protein [Mycobacterium sp.]
MTAPVWMAFPPEVHSALLNSGPGPGPLLAAAGAWNHLSTEYAAVAEELSALVVAAQAQSWQGSAASSYAAANAPYVAWLARAAADAAATAAQHETAAVSYATAQAAMPTLGELAANHATHTVLLATNFFGINTIPIALNEADYVRMWIQAATTMTVYQSVSTAAVTATPRPEAAPPIVQAGTAAASPDPLSSLTGFLTQVEQIFNSVGGGGNQSLLDYLLSVPPGTDPLSLILKDISVSSSPSTGYPALLQALVGAAGNNPALIAAAYAFGGVAIVYDVTIQVIQFLVTFPLLAASLAPMLAGPALAGLAAAGSVGIAEAAAHVHAGAEPVPIGPTAPVVSPTPTFAPGGTASAPAPTAVSPAPAPSAPMPSPAPAAPFVPGAPPPGGTPAGPFPYLMGGSVSMNSPAATMAGIKRKSWATDIADAPAALAAPAQDKARARRQRRAQVEVRGRGYEYMDLDDNAESGPYAPPTTASDRGAERLGFAGTARRPAAVAVAADADAAGMTMLAGDEFGSGPITPMMPSTWAHAGSGEAGSR